MSRNADIAIIGGGVFGCSVAYALSRAGASTILLDASTQGRASSASAGGLWPVGESLGLGCGVIYHADKNDGNADDGPQPLPREFMEFLRQSNQRFPALAQELREATGIDIELEHDTGLLYLLYDDDQVRHARGILDWMGADDPGVCAWTPEQVFERDPLVNPDLKGAIHFPGDHQVNPMLLTEGLKVAAMQAGSRLVPEARVTALQKEGDRIVAIDTTQGRFGCDVVVNAAGAWGAEIARLAGIEIPVTPVCGQIVCTETLAPGALRSNLSTVDCYVLQKAHGEVIIGSTTEHRGFDCVVRYDDVRKLVSGAVRAVPALRNASIKRTWAGLRPGTPDEFPILGPSGEIANLHHATGGFRTGIVASPLAGEFVAAGILGVELPCPADAFRADRFQVASTI